MLHFRAQVEADKRSISAQLGDLERRRPTSARQARIDALRLQLIGRDTSIHALPDDVLSYIFELGSERGRDISVSILMSHVCQRWRTVAIATAVIWSSVEIHLPDSRTAPLAREFLRRSAQSRIRLVVRLWNTSNQCSSTWLRTLVPRCDEYTLASRYYHLEEARIVDLVPKGLTSSLRILTLSDIRLRSNAFYPLLDAVESCTGLHKLVLDDFWSSEERDIVTERVIRMPELRHLELHRLAAATACCFNFISRVDAPVTTLTLLGNLVILPTTLCNRLPFAGSILTLTLHSSHIDDLSSLSNAICAMPLLQDLDVQLPRRHTQELPYPPSPVYTTRLKNLTLDGPCACQMRRFIEFLESHGLPRGGSHKRLEISLRIVWDYKSDRRERIQYEFDNMAWLLVNVTRVEHIFREPRMFLEATRDGGGMAECAVARQNGRADQTTTSAELQELEPNRPRLVFDALPDGLLSYLFELGPDLGPSISCKTQNEDGAPVTDKHDSMPSEWRKSSLAFALLQK
ncbi:hypothetical protein CALCODRAFT_505573 [Calocera cornea HHB12733]|uniref:Uncharacterized protein n=1 Tax=Calocera cornea HHB12733 TaxID=1353952 RepID=A0A165K1N2_9BASI|nr:hypothetical protein CALCODRAFT_505573 [Calocera cornea HHB12733]